MENKQYYVEIETESGTEVYECKNLNDSRECVKEVAEDLINIHGYTNDFEKVTADEYDQEDFIEGLKSIEHETFLKICYK